MQKLPEFLSKHQFEALLKMMCTPMMKEALIVMYAYALRISELCNLRATDVNLATDLLTIIGKGKTRYLPITEDTREIIRHAMTRPGKLFNVEVRTFRNYVYSAASRAQVGHVHPHMIRHSRATHLLNEGNDLADIKAVMRHESITSTVIYTHVALDRLRTVMN